jgi:serine/threonine protein phosphatase PrpC
MGGMKDGARAASVAVASFLSSLVSNRRIEPMERLQIAARDANAEVGKLVAGGGATLSALLFEDEATFTVNVGDSRISIT